MQAQLEAVFQALADGVFVFDLNGVLVRQNQAAVRSHGYKDGDVLPTTILGFAEIFELRTLEGQFVPLEQWPIVRAIRGESFSKLILNVYRKDTGQSWIYNYSGNPALNEEGKPKLAVLVARDITDQIKIEKELDRSQSHLKLISDTIPILVSYIDSNLVYRYVNKAYADWFQKPVEEILNRPVRDIVGERAFAIVKKRIDRVMSGESISFDDELHYSGQNVRYVRATYTPDVLPGGQVRGFVASVSDFTELKRTERELASSEHRFRKMTNSLPQLVWTAGPTGVVDYYNDRISLYNGVKKEVNGWRWEPLVHPEDLEKTTGAWTQAVASQSEYQCEHRILMADGSYHWHLSRAVPLPDDDGAVQRWFGTATDIHSQIESQAELKTAKEDAERANRLKSAFLANMSHEIRTPLGAILGFTDLMRDPALSTQDRDNYANIVHRNGEQLSTIINDILDLSKVEAGHLNLEFSKVSPASLARDVLNLLQVNADVKELRLEMIEEPSSPDFVVTDQGRLRQILMNIVGNAIKFTPSGFVRIRSFAEDGICHFDIQDSGIGIPESARERIFDAFVQADVTLSRRFGGTGLGLALSRQLARQLGGDVTIAETEVGRGTRFRISVRSQPERLGLSLQNMAPAAAATNQTRDALKGVRTLVVDDSEDNRTLIGHYLTAFGARVDFAGNGLEGCKKAMASEFDIVLMDIQMPEMDGYTATMKLRQAGYTRPILALTAHAMSEVRQKCLNVGCSDHLSKPINVRELVQTVSRHARRN